MRYLPRMRSRRKLLVGVGGTIAALLVLALLVPVLFQGRIAARLEAEIDAAVNARVAWGGVGLSLLRDFPNASLRVSGLSVANAKPFEGDTLVTLREARLVLDLGSV